MDGILGHILRCDDDRKSSISEVIEKKGFREAYSGNSNGWDITFDEFSRLSPGSLIVIGYDKDLDSIPRRLMYSYEAKKSSDPVTVYSIDLEEVVSSWNLPRRKFDIEGREITLPVIQPNTTYVPLPIDKISTGLLFSRTEDIIFPTELMSRMYVTEKNKQKLLKRHLMSICGSRANYGPMSEPKCEGEMTLPVAVISIKGKSGIKYLYTRRALSENIGTLSKAIEREKSDLKLHHKVKHNRRFVAKYQPLLQK